MTEALPYAAYAAHLCILAGGGLAAVTAKSMERALLGLIAAMFGVSGMYLLMNAPYLALMQLLVYVGAVGVLVFFALMLTRAPGGEAQGPSWFGVAKGALMALLPAAALAAGAYRFIGQAKDIAPEIPAQALGAGFLGRYALAFELISVVLFAAMAGAVLLGFERRRGR